ncbi:uncharacterized protein DS421_12g374200 [Arachis hypogaea]|nr:uncharacterized protein DS421_12g374200 [Arachis hypogaea]
MLSSWLLSLDIALYWDHFGIVCLISSVMDLNCHSEKDILLRSFQILTKHSVPGSFRLILIYLAASVIVEIVS